MKNNSKLATFFILGALFTLSGCLPSAGPSAPTHFYHLEYSAEPSKAINSEADKSPKSPLKLLVKVSSVGALHGSRIAIADGNYELSYQEFERWAEPLSQDVEHLLVEGLQSSFATVEGVPMPSGYHPDYKVTVTIEKLWGTRRGEIVVSASWIITDSSENVVASGAQEFRREGWHTGDYGQFAERVSKTMPLLAQAIRDSILPLDTSKKK